MTQNPTARPICDPQRRKQRTRSRWGWRAGWWLLFIVLLAACVPNATEPAAIAVMVEVDGRQQGVNVPQGASAQMALEQAGVALGELDQVDPPGYTVLSAGAVVRVTRVREAFLVEEVTIPFERKTLYNETLPENSNPLLVQNGQNGLEQVTYRQVFENDREVSKTIFQREVIVEPLPEIQMVGVQKPFTPVPIPGRLAYLAGGNAWVMEGNTGSRRPVVSSGDLDGRVFSLSPKGEWLLFTRQEPAGQVETTAQNSLWAVDLTAEETRPVRLRVQNVIAASWVPNKGLTVTYSTFEPSAAAPGWKANNDLMQLVFSTSGATAANEPLIEANYGWFGSNYLWSPDGLRLAYARPHEVGLVDLESGQLNPLVELTYYQTGEGWEWVTRLGWSPDSRSLYFVNHAAKAGLVDQETSPWFDVAAVPLGAQTAEITPGAAAPETAPDAQHGPMIALVAQAGMFAYPLPAPAWESASYPVAYLQAVSPEQSEDRYRLAVMDRDGSNRRVIFPSPDRVGMNPQVVAWSPQALENGNFWIALQYQGNLWLVDNKTVEALPVTGDGQITLFDWK